MNNEAMKTVLVTGAYGQLGTSVRRLSGAHGRFRFLFTDADTLDICKEESVDAFFRAHPAEYVLNCAAYTAVDKAEEDAELCGRINRDAVACLARAARKYRAKVVHVSTDYVFDGTSCIPYRETDRTNPRSVYGSTKRDGEEALLGICPDAVVVRTAWLYSEYGNNFVKTMLRLGSEREELRVVSDQVGSPTYAADLATALLAILEQDGQGRHQPGIYHFTDEGVCSWYDFAVKIIGLAGLKARVLPVASEEYPTKAVRPHFSVLDKRKIKSAYGLAIPHWEESLRKCMENMDVIKK